MTQLEQKLVVPPAVMQKLESVRGRTLWVKVGTALVVAIGVLLAGMGLAMLVDWLAALQDSSWRMVLTGSTIAVAAATLGVLVRIARRQSKQLDRVAAQVDQEIPELEERWATVAELSRAAHANNIHPAMFRQVAHEANQWSPKIEVQQVVPLDRMIRALLCLAAVTAILGVAVLFDSQRASVLLQRFWSPSASISATTVTVVSDLPVVGRGESLELAALVEGSPIEYATLLLDPSKGESQSITLVPRGEDEVRVSHRIRSVTAPLRYRIRAGDGQTPWHEVRVADRPELGEVRITIIPPAYTKEEPVELEKLPRSITVLEGSVFRLAMKPKAAVTSFELLLGGELRQSLLADQKGWYHWETTLTESFILSPQLTEENGLTNRKPPRCEVKCRFDAPPAVKLITPDNAIAVLPDDIVSITFAAKDDVGIGSAELVLYGEGLDLDGDPVPLATLPIELGEQRGASEILATVELDLSKYQLPNGTELTYAVRVSEDRSGGQTSDTEGDAEEDPSEIGSTTESTSQDLPNDNATDSLEAVSPAKVTPADETADDKPADNEESAQAPSTPEKSIAPATEGEKTQPSTGESKRPAKEKTVAEDAKPEVTEAKSQADASPADSSPVTEPTKAPPSEKTAPKEPSTDAKPTTPSDSQATTARNEKSEPEKKSTQNRSASSQKKSMKTAAADKQTAKSSKNNNQANQMSMRQLDVAPPQSTSSKRMMLKIDETAGSFSGQQRIKLEMAIAPRLEELGQSLEKAQRLSRSVLDDLSSPEAWESKHGRDTTAAERQILAALAVVDFVEKRSKGTPYAFVGLQMVDISLAHIEPARRDFWKSLQSDGEARVESIRNGWQHTGRALDLLVRLTERFDRARREYATAETVEKIKKMYQVYVENSLALLRPEGDSGLYSRKRVEFDLDEEYLARLKEVLEMRNELRAELARILAEDPRLLRRYLDRQRNSNNVLRSELADLAEKQSELNRKTKAWTMVEQPQRAQLASVLLQRHVRDVEEIALSAADLHDRFETWLPLERNVDDADLTATAELLQQIATATSEVNRVAGLYIGQQGSVKKTQPKQATPDEAGEADEADDQDATDDEAPNEALAAVVADAEKLYSLFNRLEVLLRQIGLREDGAGLADFSTRRLRDTRRLIEITSAWIRQLKSHQAGEYHRAAEVEQYQLAMLTDTLAGKLANIEQNLAGLLQRNDGSIPEAIAEKSRLLLSVLDEQVTPNQLGAVYALRRNQLQRANSRQVSALEALELAGRTYDEMIELTIIELDKLPVADPLADRDPTLDELLARLEQEVDFADQLGIPRRPTNLQIIRDWNPSGEGNAGGNNQMVINQFREQQRQRQRAIEKAYRQALARAAKEANADNLVDAMPAAPARATRDWNVLASQLQDDLQQGRDSAPPERFRQAIEQYFRQISKSKAEDSSPAE